MSAPAKTDTIIELHVPDFEKTREFYGKLGFKVVWETKAEGTKGYLVMKKGESILCFYSGNANVYSHPYFNKFSRNTKRGYGVEIIIFIDDIENYYIKLKELANITEELKMQPWGKKDFRIEDPFGYYIRFSEPYDTLQP